MKILFVGCVESSYKLLEKLIEIHADIVGVITKKESAFNSDFCDLIPLCRKAKLPFITVKNVNDEDSVAFINRKKPDIGFCFGWSQLVKDNVIRLFPMGMVGFHPAELPMNRGRHPTIWALVLGLTETASTFFILTPGADEGDIVSQKKLPIDYDDDARSIYDKIMNVAVLQEETLVSDFEKGIVKRVPQNVKKGNVWRKRSKADGEIDWRMSSRSIYNLVRALTKPYVGAHFAYNGNEYKVWKVQEIRTNGLENIEPGKILAKNQDGTIDIKTGVDGIRLVQYDAFDLNEGDYIL